MFSVHVKIKFKIFKKDNLDYQTKKERKITVGPKLTYDKYYYFIVL